MRMERVMGARTRFIFCAKEFSFPTQGHIIRIAFLNHTWDGSLENVLKGDMT